MKQIVSIMKDSIKQLVKPFITGDSVLANRHLDNIIKVEYDHGSANMDVIDYKLEVAFRLPVYDTDLFPAGGENITVDGDQSKWVCAEDIIEEMTEQELKEAAIEYASGLVTWECVTDEYF